MSNFGYRKELNKYEDVDEDELLATLTNEELQELEKEMSEMEPDENTPIGLRQQDQRVKQATGVFCREALLKHWQNETQKLLETERSNCVLQQDSMDESQTDKSEEEYLTESDIKAYEVTLSPLRNKKEEESQNRRHGRLKQMKNQNMILNKSSEPDGMKTGSNVHCRGKLHYQVNSNLIAMPDTTSRNSMDTDKILEMILRNDESVKEVNLNNIENISQGMLISFAEALISNMHVRAFSLANTRADDQVAFALANMLKKNQYITSLNTESNFISGKGILALVRSLQQNSSLVELRFHNQRHMCGGQVEMEMVKLLRENTTLLKLGYQFDLPGPRMSATSILTRNQDQQRQSRMQLRRQNEQSEETMNQTAHNSDGSNAISQNMPDKKPITFSQEQKHNSLHKPEPQQPSVHCEQHVPTRNIAEVVKLQEDISVYKQGQTKLNTKKMHNQMKERESGDVFNDAKLALKPAPRKKQEDRNGQLSLHGDLMAAIRSSRVTTLSRVSVLHQQY